MPYVKHTTKDSRIGSKINESPQNSLLTWRACSWYPSKVAHRLSERARERGTGESFFCSLKPPLPAYQSSESAPGSHRPPTLLLRIQNAVIQSPCKYTGRTSPKRSVHEDTPLDAACTADPPVTSAVLAQFGQKTGRIWGRGSPDEPYPNLPIPPNPVLRSRPSSLGQGRVSRPLPWWILGRRKVLLIQP